jgi:HK97 family phage major capsid protein
MTVNLQKAINEATADEGGSFVPDEQGKLFLELVQQENTAIPLCRSFTMKTDVLNIPTVSSGNTAYWVNENTDITTSDISTGQITLTAKKVAALTAASTEVLEDATPEIAQVLNEQLGKDVSIKVDQAIYNGGTTGYTDSGINGFRDRTTYTDINAVNASSGEISVSLILQAKKAIRNDYFAAGGTHLIVNPDVVYKLENLTDSNGRPIFSAMDTNNPLYSNGVLGRILGLTVVATPAIPTSSNLSDAIIITKNVSGYYGMKRGFKFYKVYKEVKDNYNIQTNMRMAFRVAYQKSMAVIYDIKTN